MASRNDKSVREPRYSDAAAIAKTQLENQEAGGDLKIPADMNIYDVSDAGAYTFDVIPFVCGKNVKVIDDRLEEGDLHPELVYWRHQGVGPEEKNICCLRNWGERCPLCDRASAFKKRSSDSDEDKDAYNSMKAKLRAVFGVIDPDQKGKPKIELFSYSWHGFAKQLAAKITGPLAVRQGYNKYHHAKGGMTIQVQMSKTDMGKWLQASNIEMLSRKEDLTEWLEKMPCLDEMLIRHTAEEVVKIADGVPLKDDDDRSSNRGEHPNVRDNGEDKEPERKPARKAEEVENLAAKMGIEEDTVVLYRRARCKVLALNKSGTKVLLEDVETKTEYDDVPVENCSIPEPEEGKPQRRGGKKAPASEHEDDDKPRRTGRTTTSRDDGEGDKNWKKPDPDADKPSEEDDDKPRRRGGRNN